jgi:hypothetical protein
VSPKHVLDDRQTEAGATPRSGIFHINSVKAFRYSIKVLFGYS